jgi:Ca2+-transporting ATPase
MLDKQTAPLFTVNMYKQILLQSVYQITVILPFHFLGVKILGFELTSANDTIVQTWSSTHSSSPKFSTR